MSRIKSAAKKTQWMELPPHARLTAFIHGDAPLRHPDEHQLARRIFEVANDVKVHFDPDSEVKHLEFLERSKILQTPDELEPVRRFQKNLEKLREKSRHPIKVFTKSKNGSLEQGCQQVMSDALQLLIECFKKRNCSKLRALADVMDAMFSGAIVDRRRFALTILLYKETPPPNARLTNQPKNMTFTEILNEMDRQFPDNLLDAKTLREWLKEMNFLCKPDKRGPKVRAERMY